MRIYVIKVVYLETVVLASRRLDGCPLCTPFPERAGTPRPPSRKHALARAYVSRVHAGARAVRMSPCHQTARGDCSRLLCFSGALQHLQHPINFCNIQMKLFQHTRETYETLATYV